MNKREDASQPGSLKDTVRQWGTFLHCERNVDRQQVCEKSESHLNALCIFTSKNSSLTVRKGASA